MEAMAGPRGRMPRWAPFDAEGFIGRLTAVVALTLLSALPALFLAPLFTAPFEVDQGTYATVARGWLDGAVPYRDLWDNKGPLLFLWYVASFAWLGESVVAPRVAAAIAAGLSVPFVWLSARNLLPPREAALAAGLFSLSFANVYLQVTANAEVFMLLPMTAGFWAFTSGARSGRLGWFLLAGALTALALLTRQSAVWTFVAYGLWLGVLFLRNPPERQRHAGAAILLGAGALLGALPFVVYFAVHGALYELWYALFGFNVGWAGEFPLYFKLIPPLFVNAVPLVGGLAFWALAAVGLWRLWRVGGRLSWLLIAFAGCSLLATQNVGKLSPHYSIQLLPGAAIAAAVGLPFVVERWRNGHRRLGYGLSVAAVLMVGAIVFAYARPTASERFEVQYLFLWDYSRDAIEAQSIATAVESMTEPGDYVYDWGRESEIYFLADRKPASRYFYNRVYSVDPTMIHEVLRDLRETQPAVIYLTYEVGEYERAEEGPPPALAAYLDEHYRYAGKVAYADIYQRREG